MPRGGRVSVKEWLQCDWRGALPGRLSMAGWSDHTRSPRTLHCRGAESLFERGSLCVSSDRIDLLIAAKPEIEGFLEVIVRRPATSALFADARKARRSRL